MSNKRKHVEIESELNNTETQNNDNHGVEAPSRGPTSDYLSNNESSNQDNDQGGQDNQEPNGPTSQEEGTNNDNGKPYNQDENLNNGNTNNKVFDGRVDDNNLDSDSSGHKVEVGGGQLSNQDSTSNKNDDSNHQENPNNDKVSDKDNKDNENSNKEKNKDNDQQNKEKPSQSNNDKDTKNKVSDSSNKEDGLGNGLKSVASEKLGKYSDTADKLNKIRNFKDLKNMSKEQATREAIDIGKDLAKKKITALIVTYVGPYILPILAGIVVLFITIFIILAAIIGSSSNNSKTKIDCGPVNDHSSDITASKDAMKNAEKIYEYEMTHVDGAKPKAVAAHLGNMEVESAHTFDPKTIQGNNSFKESIAMDESVGGYAFGLAQWDSGRRVNLLKYAKKEGKKWSDFGLQLDFLLNHDGSDSDTIKNILKSDGSVHSITERIMNEWERAGDKSSLSERQSAASKFYSKFGKKDVGSSDGNLDDATDAASDNSDASENSGCSTTDDTGGSGKIGDSVKANGKSGQIKEQWNSKKEIPAKYKKHIQIPDFKESVLNSPENVFPATGNKGQCTELTWGYMKQMYGGTQPTNGNGNVIYKAYEQAGAKVTENPTVGYGFSSNPPYAGAADASVGHTGIVAGVMDNGDWIMANYNLNGEGNNGQRRHLTYALVDGNKKSGGIKFFSGVGKPKVKSKD
ncbi:TPA: hypothetical protein PBT65_001753 [Staphylococcus aureus]|nr:hypothetical protein [Staphylococcus aureus]